MSRPPKNTVDYFPFYCKEGKSMYYIENKYGNDGFAAWVKILRAMATTNYHFLNLGLKEDWMFLSAKCKVTEVVLLDIINDLVRFGEFNEELWIEYKILAGEKFLASIADAYKKRNTNPPSLPNLVNHLIGLGVLKTPVNSVKVPDNTERIEKNSIEKKTIEYYLAEAKKKYDLLLSDTGWVEVCKMQLKVPPEDFAPALAHFFSGLPPTSYEYNEKQLKQHFYYWYSKHKTNWRNNGTKQQNTSVTQNHAELENLSRLANAVLEKLTGGEHPDGAH